MNNTIPLTWKTAGALFLAVIALAAVGITFGRSHYIPPTGPGGKPNGISVSGHGRVTAVPNTAKVSLGIVTHDKSARKAAEDNERIAQAIKDAVKHLGVAEKDFQTRDYSTSPWYKYPPHGKAVQVGYKVNNTVGVTVRDLKKVGDILDAATKAGANSVEGIRFTVDSADLREKALNAAIRNAQQKAQTIAETLNVKVGRPISVEESQGYESVAEMPAITFKRALTSARTRPPISPGQVETTQDVEVIFAIR